MKKVQVEGFSNLFRDKYSGAILNCNIQEMASVKQRKTNINKMNSLEHKIQDLENDIAMLKSMMTKMLKENNK